MWKIKGRSSNTSTWSKGFVTSKGRSSSLCGKSGPAQTQLYQVTSPAACKSTFGLWKTFHITNCNYNQLSWFNFQTVPSKRITSNHPTKPSSLTLFSVYDEVNVSNPLKKKHRHSQSSSCWCSSQICNAALQALATAQLPKALERATLCGVKPNSWRCDNCLGK